MAQDQKSALDEAVAAFKRFQELGRQPLTEALKKQITAREAAKKEAERLARERAATIHSAP